MPSLLMSAPKNLNHPIRIALHAHIFKNLMLFKNCTLSDIGMAVLVPQRQTPYPVAPTKRGRMGCSSLVFFEEGLWLSSALHGKGPKAKIHACRTTRLYKQCFKRFQDYTKCSGVVLNLPQLNPCPSPTLGIYRRLRL